MEAAALHDALSRPVHGTNPINLIEKIVRNRITQSNYWLQHCFAMNAERLVEKAAGEWSLGSRGWC